MMEAPSHDGSKAEAQSQSVSGEKYKFTGTVSAWAQSSAAVLQHLTPLTRSGSPSGSFVDATEPVTWSQSLLLNTALADKQTGLALIQAQA